MVYYHSHFIDEETEAQRLNNLSKVTEWKSDVLFCLYFCIHGYILNCLWVLFLSWINVSHFPSTGCMFEKGPRQFYDDTCVVPEKFDGRFFIVYQVLISLRGSGEITLASPESSQHCYLKIFMLITYSALKSR